MVKIAIPNFCINFLNKTEKSLPILCDFAVTSLADAWIKITQAFEKTKLDYRHIPCGCVD